MRVYDAAVTAVSKCQKSLRVDCSRCLPPAHVFLPSRVRNREHARNTRIRKKQYVESLKVQVGEMIQAQAREERDAELESNKITAEVREREGGMDQWWMKGKGLLFGGLLRICFHDTHFHALAKCFAAVLRCAWARRVKCWCCVVSMR